MNTQRRILATANAGHGLGFRRRQAGEIERSAAGRTMAIQEQTKGALIKSLSKETEKGKTFSEAETRLNGHGRDVLFDKTGALDHKTEFTQEIPRDVGKSVLSHEWRRSRGY